MQELSKKKINFPKAVLNILFNFDCWLVGSAAKNMDMLSRDYDILCPFHNWNKLCLIIPSDAKPNSFGGWKFSIDGVEIDLWPGDMSHFMTLPKFEYAYNLRHEVKIGRIKE